MTGKVSTATYASRLIIILSTNSAVLNMKGVFEMSRRIRVTVGSVSWIHQRVTPIKLPLLVEGKMYEPNWIPQTYIGLYATRNPAPTNNLDLTFYRSSRQFRAMTFADLIVETSDDGNIILNVSKEHTFLDAGFTPPFDRNISFLTKYYVPDDSMKDTAFHPGELGNCSNIFLRRRHPNTTIAQNSPTGNIIASALIAFRAGEHTDGIGVNVVKSTYHVPWVWCEWLLTYDKGSFTALGTGSAFPTHTFYVNGVCYGQQDEPTDASFVTSWRHPLTIDTSVLRVYPVLTTGAPATPGSKNVRDATRNVAGPVATIPYTVFGTGRNSFATF